MFLKRLGVRSVWDLSGASATISLLFLCAFPFFPKDFEDLGFEEILAFCSVFLAYH